MKVRRATRYQKLVDCYWSHIASISLVKGITEIRREMNFQYSTHLENENTEGIFFLPNNCLPVCNDFQGFICEQGHI